MPFECPHCNAGIADAVSKSTMTERLNSKSTEITGLKTALSTAQTKADGYDALKSAHDTLSVEHDALKTHGVRSSSLGEIGVRDAATVKGFEAIFNSERASNPELDWSTWMSSDDGAKVHPLLSSHFKGTAAGATGDGDAGAGTPAGNPPAASGLPDSSGGNPSDPPKGKTTMSAAQLQAKFRSTEFQNMSAEDRRTEFNNLKAQYEAQG